MYLCAKKLNNSAASYIELGQHDQAISQLQKALCLIKQSSSNSSSSDTNHSVPSKTPTEQVCCCCNYCTLDECMVYSEENAPDFGVLDHEEEEETLYDNMDIDTATLSTTYFQFNKHKDDSSRYEDYIHRRPIRFTPRFLRDEGHVDMGPLLSLPFIFNLALAHHLKFVSMFTVPSDIAINTNSAVAAKRKLAIQEVLRLYELVYTLQTELIAKEQQQQLNNATTSVVCTSKSTTDPSLRLNIIICNNLSHVHKILQNHGKQKRCLQQLLSMLMYVVDMEHNSYGSNSSSSRSRIINEQEYPQVSSLSSLPSLPSLTMTTASLPSSHHRRRRRKWFFMDLDGFLQSTSHIILQDNCAMVA